MTNDIFYVFQHTRGSKLGVEYNNHDGVIMVEDCNDVGDSGMDRCFYGIIFYDYIENTIIFALK